jgi:hypothetical protein
MRVMRSLFLVAAVVAAPTWAGAHNELAREPRGVDTLVPAASPPAADSSAQKITIYTAKTIVTLDPGTPSGAAVAVMGGRVSPWGRWTRSAAGSPTRNSRSTGAFKMA